ncbi:hypothetical protein LOK49_LG06G03265 [Camellia lanceoleosa]|uniref:Uncharacterized protein n=1 Tax=Camellia lanceoleosa TaxID=1840588 RepID=A0ACC0HEM5_9ERIC|nr:hypothetical protein LOK49_LG06G03265 [Camellia lanceoleosa]
MDMKLVPYKIVNKDGKPCIEVKIKDAKPKVCSLEKVSDMILIKIKETVRHSLGRNSIKDVVVTVVGLNLGRMLEDKFLKQQEAGFSLEPYISEVVHIHQASKGFALLARVYVGNLSWAVDDLALETLFIKQGKVIEAKVVYDIDSGRSRDFGFVTFGS